MRVQLLAQRMGQVVVSSPSNILIRLRLDRAATRHTEAEQHTRSHDGPEPKTPHRRPLSSRRATARRPGRYASMVPAPLAHPHRTVTIATKTRSSNKKGRASSLRLVRSLPSQPMVIKRCPSNQSDVSSSLLTSTNRRPRKQHHGNSANDSWGQSTCWTVTPWATSYTRHATEDADLPASGGSREPDLICLYRSTRNRVPRRQRTTQWPPIEMSVGMVSLNHVCAASARAVGEMSPREPSSLRSASGTA